MRRFVDLHTHSTASDGSYGPSQIVAMADEGKLAAIALTDHDTVDGLLEARKEASQRPGIVFIAGIEVSAMCSDGIMHILGLGIDETSAELAVLVTKLRESRQHRNPQMIAKLQELGIDITLEDVFAVDSRLDSNSIISRVHMARALIDKDVVRNIDEAFGQYLGDDAPAYVAKDRIKPANVIEAIHAAGGLAILAHPAQLNYSNSAQLERIIRDLIHAALDGIEVYHTSHTRVQIREYMAIARRFELDIAGGSDFHGKGKGVSRPGRYLVPLSGITGKLRGLIDNNGESLH